MFDETSKAGMILLDTAVRDIVLYYTSNAMSSIKFNSIVLELKCILRFDYKMMMSHQLCLSLYKRHLKDEELPKVILSNLK